MKDFTPTDDGKTFLKHLVSRLTVGGTWGYKNLPLIFQKTDDKTLSVIAAWPEKATPGVVEAEIERTRITLEACGLKFSDLRAGPNPNLPTEKKDG